jgi:hypothetical protein
MATSLPGLANLAEEISSPGHTAPAGYVQAADRHSRHDASSGPGGTPRSGREIISYSASIWFSQDRA